jgi:mono/diheme cytochrome c family protein
MTAGALVSAHEKTGWVVPEEAKKLKNPIPLTKTSIQKGKETYDKKCGSCHGVSGDGKGPLSAKLDPKPTSFKEHHKIQVTDGEHFWKISKGRGPMPPFEKDLTVEERWHVINYINTFMKQK